MEKRNTKGQFMQVVSPIERFWGKVRKTGNCWLWLARINDSGYGTLRIAGKEFRAHRFSYQLHRGEIPEGFQLDHLCRVRNCVNPDHLEAVTQKENLRRGEGARLNRERLQAITHCPRGHQYSQENTYVRPDKEGYQHRYCRKCQAIRSKQRVYKQKELGGGRRLAF